METTERYSWLLFLRARLGGARTYVYVYWCGSRDLALAQLKEEAMVFCYACCSKFYTFSKLTSGMQ